jgi:hypothetical protein
MEFPLVIEPCKLDIVTPSALDQALDPVDMLHTVVGMVVGIVADHIAVGIEVDRTGAVAEDIEAVEDISLAAGTAAELWEVLWLE